MARHCEHSYGYEALKSPPSIYGAEVSAEWKRTYKGEVIMTVRMPSDTVDSEVYIKTPRGHSGIQMDPWMSSTWRRKWSTNHSPNKVTKDKLEKFNKEKTHRCISLHRTAGRQKMFKISYWSPRPNRRQNFHADHPSVKQCQLNKVRYRSSSKMEKSPRKRFREMSPARSWSDPVIIASSDEETETEDEFQLDALSPQSPPDHERGHQPLEYVPKSPVYPPPDDSSDSSVPDLETPREQMSPVQEKLKEPDHTTHMTVPADANADLDHFKDTDRQDTLGKQLDKELNEAPWNPEAGQQALEKMEKIAKTIKPAYEGFWYHNDSDILHRLNEAAKKLKDRQAEMKKDAINEVSQKEDQVSPSDKCYTCHRPVGHHLHECSKKSLQHDLKEVLHEVPVEPLTGPPK